MASIRGAAAAAADTELELVGVAEASLGQVVIDNAGGRSQSKQEGVSPSVDIDSLRIVRVERDIGYEEVAGPGRSVKTSNTRGSVRVATSAAHIGFPSATFAGSRNITKNTGYFGTSGVLKKLFDVGRSEILHELLGDDLYGSSGVFQGPTQSTASHGLGCVVAGILSCVYREGR